MTNDGKFALGVVGVLLGGILASVVLVMVVEAKSERQHARISVGR